MLGNMGGVRLMLMRRLQFMGGRTGTGNLLRPEYQGEHRNHQCT